MHLAGRAAALELDDLVGDRAQARVEVGDRLPRRLRPGDRPGQGAAGRPRGQQQRGEVRPLRRGHRQLLQQPARHAGGCGEGEADERPRPGRAVGARDEGGAEAQEVLRPGQGREVVGQGAAGQHDPDQRDGGERRPAAQQQRQRRQPAQHEDHRGPVGRRADDDAGPERVGALGQQQLLEGPEGGEQQPRRREAETAVQRGPRVVAGGAAGAGSRSTVSAAGSARGRPGRRAGRGAARRRRDARRSRPAAGPRRRGRSSRAARRWRSARRGPRPCSPSRAASRWRSPAPAAGAGCPTGRGAPSRPPAR